MRRVLEPKTLPRMIWLDYALMLGVTVIYAVVAFTNLGATKSPQTCWRSTYANDQHEDVVLDLGESRQFNMLYMSGIHSVNSDFIVRVSQDGETWSEANWAEAWAANMATTASSGIICASPTMAAATAPTAQRH